MAYTFVQAMNLSLKEAGIISGTTAELTSFTNSALQVSIDVMKTSWNDVIDELRKVTTLKNEAAESTFTLVAATHAYTLASDYEMMATDENGIPANPIDRTNNDEIYPYPGGYVALMRDRPSRTLYTGLPTAWCINPVNGKIEIDTDPTANEAGRIYTYIYAKRINMDATTDTFAFSDEAVDAMKTAVVQDYKRKTLGEKVFNERIYNAALSRAAFFIRKTKPNASYGMATASYADGT